MSTKILSKYLEKYKLHTKMYNYYKKLIFAIKKALQDIPEQLFELLL